MKKLIAIVAALAIIAGIVFFIKNKKEEPVVEEVSIVDAQVTRGPIVKSVEASGVVTSNLDVEIKCKASGEIISLPYDESDYVEKGALVLELDPEDENRNVSKAEVALASAKARLEKAKKSYEIAIEDIENSRKRAKATLEATRAKTEDTLAREQRTKELFDKKLAGKEEYDSAVTASIQAKSDLEKAEISMSEIETQVMGLELKKQDVDLAKADLESAKINLDIAKRRLADTKVYAPIDGIITLNNVQAGQIISSATSNVGGGTTVMTLSDLSRLYIIASIDESDIGQVRQGQDVEITADAFPGRVFAGIVDRISPKGKSVSNVVVFEVRIEVLKVEKSFAMHGAPPAVDNAENKENVGGDLKEDTGGDIRGGFQRGGRTEIEGEGMRAGRPGRMGRRSMSLKPEMTTNVKVIIEQKEDALYLPVEALKRKNGKTFVSVAKGEGLEDLEVETGLTDGINVEIVSGLEEGDKVKYDEKAMAGKWSAPGGGDRGGGSNSRRMMRMH